MPPGGICSRCAPTRSWRGWMRPQIGRAAGRGRGEISGGGVSFKKKKKKIVAEVVFNKKNIRHSDLSENRLVDTFQLVVSRAYACSMIGDCYDARVRHIQIRYQFE